MRAVVIAVLLVAAAVVAFRAAAIPSAIPGPGPGLVSVHEGYTSGNVVGFEIDRGAEPEVVAALDGLMGTLQWMACVPAYQLITLLQKQANTGLTTIKADSVLENLRARKTNVLATIQRLGVSPTFKSQLIQFAEYTLSSVADVVKTLQNADGFLDIKDTVAKLKTLTDGYCTPPVGGMNFGVGNSFVPTGI